MIIGDHISKYFVKNTQVRKNNRFSKNRIPREQKLTFAALKDLSLSVNDGEILGILGPNGAGKTTLLRILGHIMTPDQGRVTITDSKGNDLQNSSEAKKNIGYLSANTRLYQRLSPYELLLFASYLYDMDKVQALTRMEEIFSLLHMESFAHNKMDRLSTGQLQKTSIARCLLHNPQNYIFDEPTLGLDVLSSNNILDFMQQEKNNNKTILYSTHYLEEAEFLCDKVLIIDEGQVLALSSPKEVMAEVGSSTLRDAFVKLLGKEDSNEQKN